MDSVDYLLAKHCVLDLLESNCFFQCTALSLAHVQCHAVYPYVSTQVLDCRSYENGLALLIWDATAVPA